MTCRFYKEEDNRWYIDLPDYIRDGGSKEELEMVAGADLFLDILSQGSGAVKLILSQTPFEGAEKLHLYKTDEDVPEWGAVYHLFEYEGKETQLEIWLCSVTLFVFDQYPPVIYFKKTL